MFNVGLGELFLFCIIALIVLGPEQLPQAIRSAMQFYKKIKNLAQHVQNEVEKELQISELQDVIKQELHKIQHTEQHMQQQLDQLHQEIATLHQLKSHPIKTKYLSITLLTEQQRPSFIYIFQQKNIQGKS